MAENSPIEWTDHTWTPVVGCDAVSPACANCYAALMAARLEAMGQEKYRGLATRNGNIGKWTGVVKFWEPELVKPLTVRKASRWFLTSMGDVGHDKLTDEQVAELFGVMAVAGANGKFHREQDGCAPGGECTLYGDRKVQIEWPNHHSGPHTFMVLTKRPARLASLLSDWRFRKLAAQAAYKWAHNRTDAGYLSGGIYPFGEGDNPDRFWPMVNVFIGCTAENQERADELRPHMARIAAAGWQTFVSYEPALGPVDWKGWEFLKQLISGGESGHRARPSHPEWHRAARDFAAANGIAYLMKQWGEWMPINQLGSGDGPGQSDHPPYKKVKHQVLQLDGRVEFAFPLGAMTMLRIGKKAAGRQLDGATHDGFPEDGRG